MESTINCCVCASLLDFNGKSFCRFAICLSIFLFQCAVRIIFHTFLFAHVYVCVHFGFCVGSNLFLPFLYYKWKEAECRIELVMKTQKFQWGIPIVSEKIALELCILHMHLIWISIENARQ